MKQKTRIVLLLKNQNSVLIVKKTTADEYHLPYCSLQKIQQPIDAARSYLQNRMNILAENIEVYDVINSTNPNNLETLDNLDIVYVVDFTTQTKKILINSNHVWYNPKEVNYKLDYASSLIVNHYYGIDKVNISTKTFGSSAEKFVIYADGASRGNPGHSAAGFVIVDHEGSTISEGGEYIGITTSTVAEYYSAKIALETALAYNIKQVECRLDNSTVVNQMNEMYDVKNRDIWPIHEHIISLVKKFNKVNFVHINREFNTRADALANKILDKYIVGI